MSTTSHYYLFAGKMALKNSLPEEAITYLQEAIALRSRIYGSNVCVYVGLHTEERYEEVIDLYEELQRNEFDWTALYPFVAEAYDKEEQFDKAYEIYKVAYNDLRKM